MVITSMRPHVLFVFLLLLCGGVLPLHAETPEEWVKILSRVHGGFGSFLPVGIRIGEDAMKRLNAEPRELTVLFYQGDELHVPAPPMA